jgi:hypothetical protein
MKNEELPDLRDPRTFLKEIIIGAFIIGFILGAIVAQ